MGINLAQQWLGHIAKTRHLRTLDMVTELGVSPSQVVIEIADLDGDLDELIQAVESFRAAGFRIAIDDFDTRFSQLDRVELLKPDLIKLDFTGLTTAEKLQASTASLQALGSMAARMGAQVLCEGVETEDAFFLALSCNASFVQGYLFSEATEQPAAVDTFVGQTQALLSQFRDIAVDATARNHWKAERVAAELMALREIIRASDSDSGPDHYVPAPHLLRFYICDRAGNQVSPNYENSKGQWVENIKPKGSNWSWRPYFFELLGASGVENQLVFSDPYLDINSGQTSQTAALFIDEQRILLADLLNEHRSSLELLNSCGMRTRLLEH
jgi:hypothetical protein